LDRSGGSRWLVVFDLKGNELTRQYPCIVRNESSNGMDAVWAIFAEEMEFGEVRGGKQDILVSGLQRRYGPRHPENDGWYRFSLVDGHYRSEPLSQPTSDE
jgi:hypothetical protein